MAKTITGFRELDKKLKDFTSERAPTSLKKVFRNTTKRVCKQYILPEARNLVPEDTGFLEGELKVKALPRSRTRVGYFVGFPDPLFQGDTFYGGFIEYGWDHWRAGRIEADSFLRRPLYENEARARNESSRDFRQWASNVNRGR